MTSFSPTQQVAHRWLAAQAAERKAKAERLSAETEIISLVGMKDRGQLTTRLDDVTIVTKPNTSYSIDWAMFDEIAPAMPADIQLFTTKREPREAGIRELRERFPAQYLMLAECLTVKPVKPTVEVTPVEAQ